MEKVTVNSKKLWQASLEVGVPPQENLPALLCKISF
jgi:hypothetical protein